MHMWQRCRIRDHSVITVLCEVTHIAAKSLIHSVTNPDVDYLGKILSGIKPPEEGTTFS